MTRAKVISETKKVLKRVGNESKAVAATSRSIASLTLTNPIIVFGQLLEQVEAYNNLTLTFSACLTYLNEMSFDCLMFCIVDNFGASKTTLKDDGVSFADWIIGLARFTGQCFRLYPKKIDMSGVFQCLLNKIKKDAAYLLAIDEIISNMGGVEVLEEPSKRQIQAAAGGYSLQICEALRQLPDPSTEARQILREKLFSSNALTLDIIPPLTEQPVALRLYHLISMQRELMALQTNVKTIRQLGVQADQVNNTLRQVCTFISQNSECLLKLGLVKSDFAKLVNNYISPEIAFMLVRPLLRTSIGLSNPNNEAPLFDKSKEDMDDLLYWNILQEESEVVKAIASLGFHGEIDPTCYSFFWSLSPYDLRIPSHRYSVNIKKAKSDGDKILKASLERELQTQTLNCQSVDKMFERLRGKLFPSDGHELAFLQRCVRPRLLMSPQDAVYCWDFCYKLHSTGGGSNFKLINFLQHCFKHMIRCVLGITKTEAYYLGIFLNRVLTLCNEWRSCTNAENFERIINGMSEEDDEEEDGSISEDEPKADRIKHTIDFEEFQKMSESWHIEMVKVVEQCLQTDTYETTSTEMELEGEKQTIEQKKCTHIFGWSQAQNMLVILSQSQESFPWTASAASLLHDRLGLIVASNKHPDLITLSRRLQGSLMKRFPILRKQMLAKKKKQQEEREKKEKEKKEKEAKENKPKGYKPNKLMGSMSLDDMIGSDEDDEEEEEYLHFPNFIY